MGFPARRMRRLRRLPAMRRLVAESSLGIDDLVAPLFVRESIDAPVPIASLPGVSQHTVASLVLEAKRLASLGIGALVLFGVPTRKDPVGSGASNRDGIVQIALSELRDGLGDEMVLIADLCLDEYTDHGHCGVLDDRGEVDNDATLVRYVEVAVAQAEAGEDHHGDRKNETLEESGHTHHRGSLKGKQTAHSIDVMIAHQGSGTREFGSGIGEQQPREGSG